MTTDNPSQILQAIEGFVCDLDGERYIVAEGVTRIAASHKLAKAYPSRFRPVEDNLSFADDATATDEPGQTQGRARVRRTRATAVEPVEPITTAIKE